MGGNRLGLDLRLDTSGIAMDLGAPLAVGPARLVSLAISLGKVPGPIDLSAGPAALRTRRSRVTGVRIELPYAALGAHAEGRGMDVEVRPDTVRGLLHVEGGDLPTDLGVFVVGSAADLLLVPLHVEGEPALAAGAVEGLGSALRHAGAPAEVTSAAVRIPSVLPRLLREVFAPRGFRVPRVAEDLPCAVTVGARALALAMGSAIEVRDDAAQHVTRLTDIASLIERSAGTQSAAPVREAARLVARQLQA